MCGISGVMSSALSNSEIDRFEDLMLVSNLRGSQGSGVVTYRSDKKKGDTSHYMFAKILGNGIDIVGMESYQNCVHKSRPSIIIGHTRAPTRGDAKDKKNVHPHIYGHICGVHNGTLTKVNGKYCAYNTSDSAQFFERVAEVGIDEAMVGLEGAYAFVWFDTNQNTINFLKNDKRTLYFARPETYPSTLYWSSEYGMLAFIFGRQGIKMNIEPVPNDTLITINVDKRYQYVSGSDGWSERELKPVEVKHTHAPFTHSPTTMRRHSGSGATGTGTGIVTKKGNIDSKSGVSNTVIHLNGKVTRHGDQTRQALSALIDKENLNRRELASQLQHLKPDLSKRQLKKEIRRATAVVKTFENNYVERWKVNQILSNGCAWCGDNKTTDPRKAHWFEREQFVCDDCTHVPECAMYLGIDPEDGRIVH